MLITMSNNIFIRLVYVYVGTSNYDADYEFYKNVLRAELIWEFENFGAKVAAFNLCGKPYLLIADHVQAPSKRLIYEVENIRTAAKQLKARGWKADGNESEVPDGPCINFSDKSGNKYAILQMTRPYILEGEFQKDESKELGHLLSFSAQKDATGRKNRTDFLEYASPRHDQH